MKGHLIQKVFFNAKPNEIYSILMDSKKHSILTDSDAEIGKKRGDSFSVWGGSIRGNILELEKNKKIVLSWNCESDGWPKDHFSHLEINLKEVEGGTLVTLKQKNIPIICLEEIDQGWYDYYWTPLRKKLPRGEFSK